MLKFGLSGYLLAAIGRKNLGRVQACRHKQRIHVRSCFTPASAVNSQPMKHIRILLALVTPAVLMGACAQTVNTRGQIILPSRLEQIKVGQSTQNDVLSLLGSPSTQGTINNARWYYITSTVASKTFQPYELKDRKVVIIDFDTATGLVANIEQKTAADGKDVPIVEQTTPTHGQSLGIIDQVVGNLGGILK